MARKKINLGLTAKQDKLMKKINRQLASMRNKYANTQIFDIMLDKVNNYVSLSNKLQITKSELANKVDELKVATDLSDTDIINTILKNVERRAKSATTIEKEAKARLDNIGKLPARELKETAKAYAARIEPMVQQEILYKGRVEAELDAARDNWYNFVTNHAEIVMEDPEASAIDMDVNNISQLSYEELNNLIDRIYAYLGSH